MVLDSSALVACVLHEPERAGFLIAIAATDVRRMSAVNIFETRTVLLRRKGPDAVEEFERYRSRMALRAEPFDEAAASAAFDAYRRFGKGSGHAAQLNLGDCAAYALAMARHEPLLFKGDDFRHTDVAVAT